MTITDTYQVSPEWGSLTLPLFRQLQGNNGSPGTLLDKLHQMAFAQFQQAHIPGRKNEDWKYTPLRELLNTTFSEPLPPNDTDPVLQHLNALDATRVVFVDGHFMPQLSDAMPKGVWMGTLHDALRERSATLLLEEIITQLDSVVMSPFEALNAGVTTPGICMSVEPETQLTRPIHFVHIANGPSAVPTSSYPYRLIGIGRNASVHITESYVSNQNPGVSFTNAVNHIQLAHGAHLWHHRLQDENTQSFHINMTRVFQQKDSEYSSIAVELGSKLMRNNIEIIHRGTGITTNLFGVVMAKDRQHTDTQTFIDHAQPHCLSNELYKGIYHDYARGVFNGKIIVRPDAQKTNAFQQNNSLLLSPNAIMDSKPQLEIFADDVKCSHGATIGQLDEDAVFYLRSRGLTDMQASVLLQRAFVGEVLDKCGHEEVKNYLDKKVSAYQDD